MMKHWMMLAGLAALVAMACAPSPPPAEGAGSTGGAASAGPITNRDWVLVALGERTSVAGAGGRAPTLRLETGGRAAGFAGCNQWSAGYVLGEGSLRFEAPVTTRMACVDGGDVEPAFLDALTATTGYRVSGSELTLLGASGAVARFRAR